MKEIMGTDGRAFSDGDGNILLDGNVIPISPRSNGYSRVWLPGRGMSSTHTLVCEAWHGKPQSIKSEVDHINRDRSDNRPSNLRWATRVENIGNRVNRSGQDHPNASLSDRDVRIIRSLYAQGVCCTVIAVAFNVSRSTAWRAATERTYKGGKNE